MLLIRKFQLAASLVTETRACAAEIVWGDARHRAFRTRILHHTQDDFRAEPLRIRGRQAGIRLDNEAAEDVQPVQVIHRSFRYGLLLINAPSGSNQE